MLTNPSSDRVKAVRGLSRRSARRRTGRLLVEGPQGVREAVRFAPGSVVDLYLTAEAADRYGEIVDAARAAQRFVHEVTDEVLAAMCDADHPQGMAAVVEWEPTSFDTVLAAGPRTLVFLTNVRDPGNLGTVIRGADAARADAVLVSAESVDVTSPKVVRSTVGSLWHVPVVTGLEVTETLARLRGAGVRTFAADGSGERTVDEVDRSGPHVWVMGNEAWGLPGELLESCDEAVRVPIFGHAESLNLAMAATLCLYASTRAEAAQSGHVPQ